MVLSNKFKILTNVWKLIFNLNFKGILIFGVGAGGRIFFQMKV